MKMFKGEPRRRGSGVDITLVNKSGDTGNGIDNDTYIDLSAASAASSFCAGGSRMTDVLFPPHRF